MKPKPKGPENISLNEQKPKPRPRPLLFLIQTVLLIWLASVFVAALNYPAAMSVTIALGLLGAYYKEEMTTTRQKKIIIAQDEAIAQQKEVLKATFSLLAELKAGLESPLCKYCQSPNLYKIPDSDMGLGPAFDAILCKDCQRRQN